MEQLVYSCSKFSFLDLAFVFVVVNEVFCDFLFSFLNQRTEE